MRKNILSIVILLLLYSVMYSQISTQEVPVSFLYNLRTSVERHNLNVQFTKIGDNLRTETIEDDTITFSDPTIGELFDVSINIISLSLKSV